MGTTEAREPADGDGLQEGKPPCGGIYTPGNEGEAVAQRLEDKVRGWQALADIHHKMLGADGYSSGELIADLRRCVAHFEAAGGAMLPGQAHEARDSTGFVCGTCGETKEWGDAAPGPMVRTADGTFGLVCKGCRNQGERKASDAEDS